MATALATTAGIVALTVPAGGASQASAPGATTTAGAHQAAPRAQSKPTIVLVHGAWADGSSWAAVTAQLHAAGYQVYVAENPLRGVKSDAAYIKSYLSMVPGPIVLVAHSYGGMVITKAARGNKNVKALVYVDAYIPKKGDSVGSLTGAKPGSSLAVADPTTVFTFAPIPQGGGNVDLFVKQDLFPSIFAGGVGHRKAAVLASGQRPLAASALDEPLTTAPAWRSIPSWVLIGSADKVIPPAEQKVMAARAHAHVRRIDAPHLSMVSNPGVVTQLIKRAARHS
ncbi:alpha/beta hydrolase [Nocardioides conyzicola]